MSDNVDYLYITKIDENPPFNLLYTEVGIFPFTMNKQLQQEMRDFPNKQFRTGYGFYCPERGIDKEWLYKPSDKGLLFNSE